MEEKSIRKGWKGVGQVQEDANFQHSHGGEYKSPASTFQQNLVEKVVRNFLQKNQGSQKSELGSGSVRHTNSSDAFAERGTMDLKRVALGGSVATTSQPNKKRRFRRTQEIPWQRRLQDLQEFNQTHGHCRVPQKYPKNPSLGKWVQTMRREFKKRENG